MLLLENYVAREFLLGHMDKNELLNLVESNENLNLEIITENIEAAYDILENGLSEFGTRVLAYGIINESLDEDTISFFKHNFHLVHECINSLSAESIMLDEGFKDMAKKHIAKLALVGALAAGGGAGLDQAATHSYNAVNHYNTQKQTLQKNVDQNLANKAQLDTKEHELQRQDKDINTYGMNVQALKQTHQNAVEKLRQKQMDSHIEKINPDKDNLFTAAFKKAKNTVNQYVPHPDDERKLNNFKNSTEYEMADHTGGTYTGTPLEHEARYNTVKNKLQQKMDDLALEKNLNQTRADELKRAAKNLHDNRPGIITNQLAKAYKPIQNVKKNVQDKINALKDVKLI